MTDSQNMRRIVAALLVCSQFIAGGASGANTVLAQQPPLTVRQNGDDWCNDDRAELLVSFATGHTPGFESVLPYQAFLVSTVNRTCPHAHQLEIFVNTKTGPAQIADLDENRRLREFRENPEKAKVKLISSKLFSAYLAPVFGKQITFSDFYNEFQTQPGLNIGFLGKLHLQAIYDRINADPRFSSLAIRYALLVDGRKQYDVPIFRTAVPTAVGSAIEVEVAMDMAALATILFLSSSLQQHQKLWAEISSHLTPRAQIAISAMTVEIGNEARKFGIPTQNTMVSKSGEHKDECVPPVKTICYEGPFDNDHGGVSPNYKLYEMQRRKNGDNACYWRYLGGKVDTGVVAEPPSGVLECKTYPGFQSRRFSR